MIYFLEVGQAPADIIVPFTSVDHEVLLLGSSCHVQPFMIYFVEVTRLVGFRIILGSPR